jgi:hypothetical protein
MVLDAHRFFAEVDRHLTAPMMRFGYTPLPARVGMSDRATLLTAHPTRKRGFGWLRHMRRTHLGQEPSFTVGYEAADEDAARRLDPDQPANADEAWITYSPATGELDLSAWDRLLIRDPSWTAGHGTAASSEAELVRRIALCGQAVQALNS